MASHDDPLPGKAGGQVGFSTAGLAIGVTSLKARTASSVGQSILVLLTPPSSTILSISSGGQFDVSKQSLYAVTHHGSHFTPHQLSIATSFSTFGSQEAVVSSLKFNLHGSSKQVSASSNSGTSGGLNGKGVGLSVGLGVGSGVGSGVGFAVGPGVGSGVGGFVG